MPTGSGTLTYQGLESVIEVIALSKAKRFKKIAWFDEDDIKQEVRQKCYRTLHKYDPSRSNPHAFFSTCAENRLRDIKRGVLYKHNMPCFRCPFWSKAASKRGDHDCAAFSEKMDCDKFRRHQRYVHAKLSASHPINIDESRVRDDQYDNSVERVDLIEYIYVRLDDDLKELFDVFAKSGFNLKSVQGKDRILLTEVIIEILEEYQEEFCDE